LEGDDII